MKSEPSLQNASARRRARALVLRFGWNSMAYQILNPGMTYWFDPSGEGVVGFSRHAGYRVVAGAPVCAPERLDEVARAFEEDADRTGERVCYFGAQDRLRRRLNRTEPAGSLLLGAQPVWNPRNWLETAARKASLRAQIARARNKHVEITEHSSRNAPPNDELQVVLDGWLRGRPIPAMHFLVEPYTLSHFEDRKIFRAERDGCAVGFLVASPIPLRSGWLIEQIVRLPDAPNGTAELLLQHAMARLDAAGAAFVTLGLSPLSRRAELADATQPRWHRWVMDGVRRFGQPFYNFDGLDAFKAKFQPDGWEPVYALAASDRLTPRAMFAIAGAFCGESPMTFLLKTVRRKFSLRG